MPILLSLHTHLMLRSGSTLRLFLRRLRWRLHLRRRRSCCRSCSGREAEEKAELEELRKKQVDYEAQLHALRRQMEEKAHVEERLVGVEKELKAAELRCADQELLAATVATTTISSSAFALRKRATMNSDVVDVFDDSSQSSEDESAVAEVGEVPRIGLLSRKSLAEEQDIPPCPFQCVVDHERQVFHTALDLTRSGMHKFMTTLNKVWTILSVASDEGDVWNFPAEKLENLGDLIDDAADLLKGVKDMLGSLQRLIHPIGVDFTVKGLPTGAQQKFDFLTLHLQPWDGSLGTITTWERGSKGSLAQSDQWRDVHARVDGHHPGWQCVALRYEGAEGVGGGDGGPGPDAGQDPDNALQLRLVAPLHARPLDCRYGGDRAAD